MIAACPKCGARYRIDAAKLRPEGARLRCTRCEGVFRVQAPEVPERPNAPAPSRRSAETSTTPTAPPPPSSCTARVAVEAGVTDYWRKYVGLNGAVVGIDSVGESAPAGDLFKHFGFTVDNVVSAIDSVA